MTGLRASSIAALIATGCAVDPAVPAPGGTVYVADRGGNAILRYDAISGELVDVFAAGADSRVDRPSSVRIGPDGHVYLAAFGRGEIVRYDAASTAMMGVFYADTTALEEPVELLFHGNDLAVLGNDTNNVVILDAAGALVRTFGAPEMLGAHDMAFGPDGMLYVGLPSSIERSTALQVWDVETGTLRRDFGTYDQLASGTGIAFGDGMIYVADHERDQIVQFDAVSGGPRGVLVAEGLVAPISLDVGPDGALYIVDAEGVKRFEGGVLSTYIRAGDGHLVQPRSVTFAPSL